MQCVDQSDCLLGTTYCTIHNMSILAREHIKMVASTHEKTSALFLAGYSIQECALYIGPHLPGVLGKCQRSALEL